MHLSAGADVRRNRLPCPEKRNAETHGRDRLRLAVLVALRPPGIAGPLLGKRAAPVWRTVWVALAAS